MHTNSKFAYACIAALVTFIPYCSWAQQLYSPTSNMADIPAIHSPNASELGKFGTFPVSLYTGTVDISVPLFTISVGDINMPVSVRYDSQGCKPDNHPSWVGLNWALQAGGLITRKINAQFDECVPGPVSGVVQPNNAYYDDYNYLNSSIWVQKAFDASSFPIHADESPDEFNFSVNGLSGKFLLNHEGNWVVVSKDPRIVKVEHVASLNYSLGYVVLDRAITKFVLTDNKGMKYVFGDNSNAIEFREYGRPVQYPGYNNHNLYGALYNPDNNINNLARKTICATSWHLSKIISPAGAYIDFNYDAIQLYSAYSYTEWCPDPRYYNAQSGYVANNIYDINLTNKYSVKSSFLRSISTSNGISCLLTTSISNELKYIHQPKPITGDRFVSNPFVNDYIKLDKIELLSGTPIKSVYFKYIEDPSQRLKLSGVSIKSINDNKASNYSFEYNQLALPNYNTAMEDHWGYYNGQSYWNGFRTQNVYNITDAQMQDYYLSRNPNSSYMQAELIHKIIYPTKGYTVFEFEPHRYSRIVKHLPYITVEQLSYSEIAGGCRIKKISSYDNSANPPLIKEYFYDENYVSGNYNRQSGVLSAKPEYQTSFEFTGGPSSNTRFIKHFSSTSFTNSNAEYDNHVTYSEVTEKASEGYVVTKFRNHDNGYLDKEPFASTNNSYTKVYGSLALERGVPIETSYYTEDKLLVKVVRNEYNDSPSRYDNFIRSYQTKRSPQFLQYNISAYPIYTFYPYLKQKTTIIYPVSGIPVTTSRYFAYDSQYNLPRTVQDIDSKGIKTTLEYHYPFDLANSYNGPRPQHPETLVTFDMLNRGMMAYPVETITSANNLILKATATKYYLYNGAIIAPSAVYETELTQPLLIDQYQRLHFSPLNGDPMVQPLALDSRLVLQQSFTAYDEKGNLLNAVKKGQQTQSWLWDSQKNFLTAKVENARPEQIAFTSFEADQPASSYTWNYDTQVGQAMHLQQGPGVCGQAYYLLDGNWGVSRNNIPAGDYEVTFWAQDSWNNVYLFVDSNSQLLRQDDVYTNAQGFHLLRGRIRVNSASGSINIDAYGRRVAIDDVRLYPVGAQMATYTHTPLVGITSSSDVNSQPTYYEYDGLQRLRLVKDHQGNVLKHLEYHYQQ